MSTFKTEAVVLSKRSFFEDDRFYTIYTEDYGKLEVLVKAAAKSSSKLAGQMEPFSYVTAMIVRGRNKEMVAGVKLIKFFSFADWQSLALANVVAEIIGKLIKPGVTDEKTFCLLLKLLPFLAKEGTLEVKRLFVWKFVWQLLHSAGYGLAEATTAVFEKLPKLSAPAAAIFNQQLLNQNGSSSFVISIKILREVERYTLSFLEYILESELKSLKIFFYDKKF